MILNHLGYLQIDSLADNVDPDEMPHNATCYQELHCLQRKTFFHSHVDPGWTDNRFYEELGGPAGISANITELYNKKS